MKPCTCDRWPTWSTGWSRATATGSPEARRPAGCLASASCAAGPPRSPPARGPARPCAATVLASVRASSASSSSSSTSSAVSSSSAIWRLRSSISPWTAACERASRSVTVASALVVRRPGRLLDGRGRLQGGLGRGQLLGVGVRVGDDLQVRTAGGLLGHAVVPTTRRTPAPRAARRRPRPRTPRDPVLDSAVTSSPLRSALRAVRVEHRGRQRRLDLVGDRLGDLGAERRGDAAGPGGHGGRQLPPLLGQLAQLLAVERLRPRRAAPRPRPAPGRPARSRAAPAC